MNPFCNVLVSTYFEECNIFNHKNQKSNSLKFFLNIYIVGLFRDNSRGVSANSGVKSLQITAPVTWYVYFQILCVSLVVLTATVHCVRYRSSCARWKSSASSKRYYWSKIAANVCTSHVLCIFPDPVCLTCRPDCHCTLCSIQKQLCSMEK